MMTQISTKQLSTRIKQACAALRAAGAKRLSVDLLPDGGARVTEIGETPAADDEGTRVGRLIEERMGHG